MGRVFALDSPLMNGLGKLADLIWLNILVMICSIPVITAGASLTALHYVVLKMVKNEESYITKSFFKSFKQNFRQATVMTVIILAAALIFIFDFAACYSGTLTLPGWFLIFMVGVALLVILALMHLFPLLSRYENSIAKTFRNSAFMAVLHFPKTVLMMLCWCVPIAVSLIIPPMTPIALILGISGPAYLNALLYKKSFQKLEPEEETVSDLEWTVSVPEEETEDQREYTEGEEKAGEPETVYAGEDNE